ncbi:MAG: radical SAM protein [Gammaproteobacteria bacterium]|nr:radical SAM protein [Gammaproteobacteria bacterium]
MASVIRPDSVPYVGPPEAAGLFVFRCSRAAALDIPHLPIVDVDRAGAASVSHCVVPRVIIDSPVFEQQFSPGDIVRLDPRAGRVRTLLSQRANANTLLVTERCNNRCTFCSQPPNGLPDNWLYHDATLALLNYNASDMVGISGDEPTLNQQGLERLLSALGEAGLNTPLHILSNGRAFANPRSLSANIAETLSALRITVGRTR